LAKTLAQVNAQIAKLQKEAQTLKSKEVSGVVRRIREAIEHYGLTADDLGLSRTRVVKRREAVTPASGKPGRKRRGALRSAGVVKFRDEEGRTWTGHGRAPNWYKAALESGKAPEDLRVKE